ncbi:MAG: transglycosylase domain-containing protein, partial [Chitinophagaceae bacterium]
MRRKRFRIPLGMLFFLFCCFLSFLLLNLVFPLKADPEYSTVITDNQGEIIHGFLTRDDKWRMKTELSEISPLLRKTIVEKEDRYFYHHPGINPLAIGRALLKNIFLQKRTSGASTITMQVARALNPGSRTYSRKLVEMFRALQLEMKYSKDEILQLYLNLVPYGSNIEGVKAASFIYFKKSPDHLSLAEIVSLAIIPNRPSSLVMGRNNDLIVQARNRWLERFREKKIFSSQELEDALREPLNASRGPVPQLIPQLSLSLKTPAATLVKTSIDLNTQLKVEKLVSDYVNGLYLKKIRNAAVVVIDNSNHQVITYVGSANFRDTIDGGQVNGVVAIREPGSTLKPLLYGLCIDAGILT